jgi:vitamin B12 transporter
LLNYEGSVLAGEQASDHCFLKVNPMFIKPTKVALACAGIFATISTAQAQTNSEFNPVVVSASRTEQSLSDVLPSVSVISRADIDKSQATNLADLLQGEAGFEFGRNGGPGSLTSFFLRGQDSKNVVVIVDGVRLKDEVTGTSQVENISLSQIERIELLRGNASALYGQGAVGGVVQIFTKAGKGDPKAYSSISYGSRNTSDIAVGYGGQVDDYKFNFGVSRQETSGYSAINSSQYPNANSDKDGYLNNSMSGSLSKGLGGGNEIGVRVNATHAKLDYDDAYGVRADLHTQTSANYLTGLYLKNQINDRWMSRLDMNASQVEIKAHTNGGLNTNNDTRQNQVRWFNTYQYSEAQSFNFGAEDVRANSVTTSNGDASRNARAIFVGYQGKYDRLSSQLNIRYDNITSGQEATTGLLGLGYQLTQSLKAVSSISSGFNAPTLFEQTNTPRLATEKYKSKEFGFVQANQRGLTRLIYFNTSTTSAILYDGSFQGSNDYSNIGRVENSGVELSSKLSLNDYVLKLSAVTQDPWDVSNNRQLQRRAKQYGSVDVSRTIGFYDLGVKLYGSAERKDTTGGPGTLSGYSIWSFYASKKIDKEWTARLKLDNAFDRDYQLAYGYNTPGRGVFATLQYQPK